MPKGKKLYSGNRFRKALRYFVVGRAAQAVAMLAFTLLTVRLLAPADYGAYMVLLGIIEVCRPLSSLGLLPALQQFLPEMALHATRPQLVRFVKWTTLLRFALLAVFAVVLYAFWEPVTSWLGFTGTQHAGTGIACAMVITVLGATFTDHMLEALLEQRFAQTLRALYPLLRLLGLLALAGVGMVSLQAMLWVDFAASLLCLVLAEWALVRQIAKLEPDGSRHFSFKEIASFTWHLSGAQLLNAAATPGTLRIVVARLLGVEAAGQFAFMQQLLTQFNRFLPSLLLANLVRPMLIARNVEGDVAGVATASGLLWKSNVLLVWPVVGVMVVAGDTLIGLLGGSRLPPVGLAMAWMMLSSASAAQSQIVSMVMQVYRYSALVRTVSLASLSAPLLVWAGANFGLAGAAAGLAAAAWVRSSLGVTLLQTQDRGIALDWSGGLRVLAVLTLATAAAWFAASWVGPLPAALGLLVLYAVLVALVKPLSAAEFDVVGKVLGARAGRLSFLARAG